MDSSAAAVQSSDLLILRNRWLETQQVEDESNYLVAKVKNEILRPEAIQVAAYAGHPAARRIELTRPNDPAMRGDVEEWIFGLQQWGKPVLVAAARSAAVTTLRAARNMGHGLLPDHAKIIACVLDTTNDYRVYQSAIADLSQQVYEHIYKKAQVTPFSGIGSAFTWLCYTAIWPDETLSRIPRTPRKVAVSAAIETATIAFNLSPKMTLPQLKRDLVCWTLGENG